MYKYETQVIKEIQDLTHLNWTKTRRSSGSAGSFLKAFDLKNGLKYYYKLSNYDVINGIVGHECVNEIIVDRLLGALGISHLAYHLVHAKIKIKDKSVTTYLCESIDFKQPKESKVALDVYYELESLKGETPLDFCIRMGWDEYIYNMLIIDFLILNRDRHGANIEVLKNSDKKTVNLAPLFDHGLSLCFSSYDDSSLLDINPKDDKKIQSFVGGHSSFDNLNLIPSNYLIKLPTFNDSLREYLFKDLEEVMSENWQKAIWDFLKIRAGLYEDFCNNKQ